MSKIRIRDDDLEKKNMAGRFDRFELIGWWDQKKLSALKVLVIGAGALGNEILKNLALLGVGSIFVADMDRIENSNLSRSVLYRESDNGKFKAETAAAELKNIYPDCRVQFFNGNTVYDLGIGVYRWADLVLGGLDNREARVSINRMCRLLGKTWIDGAIEQIQGVARVFAPNGPCYECTMSEADWQMLNKRRSCNLLSRGEMLEGKIPTTPTISSIIAGIQCQEMVKFIHGMDTVKGGWVFNGISAESYIVEYQEDDGCFAHESLDEVRELNAGTGDITLRELLKRAQSDLGSESDTTLEFTRDVLEKMHCPVCGKDEEIFRSLGKVKLSDAQCPYCSSEKRDISNFCTIRGSEGFLDKTFREIGIPPFDIVTARRAENIIGYEFTKDRKEVLGPLA